MLLDILLLVVVCCVLTYVDLPKVVRIILIIVAAVLAVLVLFDVLALAGITASGSPYLRRGW